MDYSRRKMDLTGQRYGRLTVLGPAENIGARTAWRCVCDCGREVVVRSYRLRSGHTKSCGCMNRGPTYVDGTSPDMLRAAKNTRKNNTSGVPGVDWVPSKARWRATIGFKGKRHYLGSYRTFEEAVQARKRGEKQFHDSFLDEYAGGATPGAGADS